MNIITAHVPKTRFSFVNVPLVPVRTRAGQTRYLCATWGGAMHLFDRHGRGTVIPYPEDTAGSYSFIPDRDDGFAWAVHTGGKITRIDVDRGAYDLVQDVPLQGLNWSAGLTRDGLLVCTAHPGQAMVYDTLTRKTLHMFTPIVPVNTKGKPVLSAPDGWVVIPMLNPGAELVRLNPRTGENRSMLTLEDTIYTFPHTITFLPDGRMALPRAMHVDTLAYPDFTPGPAIAYPEPGGDWSSFRDAGDGRVYAWQGDGQPLYRFNDDGRWEPYIERFSPIYRHRPLAMFSALPEGGLLSLTQFGELVETDRTGRQTSVAQLANLGHQRLSAIAPGVGDQVFTTTFINSSMQELNIRTGHGRNITPCQDHSGQTNALLWFKDKLWLAAYGGAEINVFDPAADGEWPDNPRPAVLIGEEQMRPLALKTDGENLWCVTNAKYGLLNGALSRIDPATLTHKVWRGLVPESNPTSLVLHDGMAYVGTTIHRDQAGGPPGPLPGAVVAFDTALERIAWIARPDAGAVAIKVIGTLNAQQPTPNAQQPRRGDQHLDVGRSHSETPEGPASPTTQRTGELLATSQTPEGPELLRLALDSGVLIQKASLHFETRNRPWRLFMSGGRLCLAVEDGIFLYGFERGIGERIVPGPVSPDPEPVTRGEDLFFVRGYQVVLAEGLWTEDKR